MLPIKKMKSSRRGAETQIEIGYSNTFGLSLAVFVKVIFFNELQRHRVHVQKSERRLLLITSGEKRERTAEVKFIGTY